MLPAKGWSSGSGWAPGRRARRPRDLGVVAVEIGAESVGNDPRVEDPARHVEAEVRAVAHVDAEAARKRLADDGVHVSRAVDEAAGMASEWMREDVPRTEDLDHAREDRVRIRVARPRLGERPELAEVDVEREVGLAGDLGAEAQDVEPPARHAADLGVGLDAANQVRVLLGGADGGGDVDAVGTVERRVVVALEPPDQIGGQEGVDPGRRRLGDELPEARERHAAWAALVDHRGRPRMHAHHVGLEAEAAGDVLVDVRVGIDEPGKDDLAAGVDDLARRAGCERRSHRRDAAVAHAHVERGVHALGRVDHAAAPKHEVVGAPRHGVLPGLILAPAPVTAHSSCQAVTAWPMSRRAGRSRSRAGARPRGAPRWMRPAVASMARPS